MTRAGLAALVLGLAAARATLADPFDDALLAASAGRHGEAAASFHELAVAGDGAAAYNLALLFATGRGLPQNRSEAAYWAWRARLGGVPAATNLLEALWPPADETHRKLIAERLEADFLPLAQGGDGAAMLRLAVVLTAVREAPDPLAAHAWLSIAAALDVPGAIAARDLAVAELPPTERAKAQDAALAAFDQWCAQLVSAPPAACAVVQPAP